MNIPHNYHPFCQACFFTNQRKNDGAFGCSHSSTGGGIDRHTTPDQQLCPNVQPTSLQYTTTATATATATTPSALHR